MISDKKEALYLVDNESYLHLKEMEAGFAYEAFDKATGAARYTGLITYEDMLENPIRNPLACARVMAIQEIGFKGEVVSGVALRTLDQIKDARRAYRKAHREDPHDHSMLHVTYGSKITIFENVIPLSVKAAETSAEGISIYAHCPRSKVSNAYKSLTQEVLENEK